MSRVEDLGRLREEIQVGHRDRMEFVTNLRQTVAGLRKSFVDENRAAHVAWFGPTQAQVRASEKAAQRASEEAERTAAKEAAQRASEKAERTAAKKRGKPKK